MLKHYLNSAIAYATMGLASGLFYREFTKYMNFEGNTRLSLMHGHYISLGLFFFLFLAILEKQFSWSKIGKSKAFVITYHVGLNISVIGFIMRGLTEVLKVDMSSGLNASIAGISGIGHILLAVSMIAILLKIKKTI